MTLALLESIIFNRLTGPQSSPLTPATTISSLRVSRLDIYNAIMVECPSIQWRPSQRNIPVRPWNTLQDVLNSFPEPEPVTMERETGNP
jgi:hypothetical protein